MSHRGLPSVHNDRRASDVIEGSACALRHVDCMIIIISENGVLICNC